jgi:hypothetical protein
MGMQVALSIGPWWCSRWPAGMILAWAMAGTVLRLAQEEVTGTKLFAYVRVLGVRKLLARMIARRFRKQVHGRRGQDRGPLKTSADMVLLASAIQR